MEYTVVFRKQALKEWVKITEPYYSNIKQSIYKLANNPRPQGCIKLKGRDGYRIRVGNYRIIYEIIDIELVVDIIALGHRKNIYE